MIIVKNKEINTSKWINLLEKSEFSTPLQGPEFYELFNTAEEYSAEVFAIEEDDVYKALMIITIQKEKGIKGFFSIRGIVYGGAILLDNEPKYLEVLLAEVKNYFKRKLIYLEIRNHADYSSLIPSFNKFGWQYEEHLNVILNLENTSLDSILSGMKYNKRREIRISYEAGATTRQAKNKEEVIAFYNILKDIYLERVKLPLLSFSFFMELYNSGIGKVFVVLHENKIIGGSFCLIYDNMAINTFYYAGIRGYHKKIFPTHLAVMAAIEYALENNLKKVDFMGAGKPNVDYGVRDYKLQFGGDLVNHGRFNIIFKKTLYKLGIWGLAVISKMK